MRKRLSLWGLRLIIVAGYVLPHYLIDEGLPDEGSPSRQAAREALATAQQQMGNLEMPIITKLRLRSWQASDQGSKGHVRVYTLFGIPYADVEVHRNKQQPWAPNGTG